MTADELLSPNLQADRASQLHLVATSPSLKEQKFLQLSLPLKGHLGGYQPLIEPAYFQRVDTVQEKHVLEKSVYQKLFLPHLPSSFIEPDEYQREYTTEGGSAFYTTAVRYDPETGGMNPTGFGMIVASGEFYGAESQIQPVTNTTVHIGYKDHEADSVSVLTQDIAGLAAFYEKGEVAPIPTIVVFSGPFVKDTEYKTTTGESLRHEGDLLVIERVLFDKDSEKLSRREQIIAPYAMDNQLVSLLRKEGHSEQSDDSDHAFIHNRTQEDEEHISFEVPQRYPVSFISIPKPE